MASVVFNSADDIGAGGEQDQEKRLEILAASLWRLEKDEANKRWIVVEDDSAIAKLGLTRADFPDAVPPAVPEWVEPERVIPQEITARQARLALLSAGLLDDIEAVIALPETPRLFKIEWEYATSFNRVSDTIAAVAAPAGLTDEQIDDLFIVAASL